MQAVFPDFNDWINQLPDPRRQEFCLYTGSHLWWSIISMFLFRAGSRNAFDEQRLTGELPWNMGELCGQSATDPRFDGQPTITGSDNAAYHAGRVDPETVRELPLQMINLLMKRRFFDRARLFDHWYTLIVDGTVQEKCRQNFTQGGKGASQTEARYRYVLQVLIRGPEGVAFPLMHESMDLHDPVADKEDCELKAFRRVAQRLKTQFPRLPICLVGDALYVCETVIQVCQQNQWKYILTFKEGRQPTTWSELLALLPLNRANHRRVCSGQDGKTGLQDYRWVEHLMLGEGQTNGVLLGEITAKTATLYAYATNFENLTAQRVETIVGAGRARHLIEDHFNTEKNHGIGLEHVFCANQNGSKNYFTMMQVAQILWNLLAHGCLYRLYQWARDATARGLARAIWEALQAYRLPPDLPPLGQIRFCSD